MAGIDTYRRNLRSSVRGLWQGVLTTRQTRSAFNATLDRGLSRAWLEGAKECGISEDELTQDELIARDEAIENQKEFVSGFLAVIRENSRANKGKLTPLFTRLNLWVTRYEEIKSTAKAMACKDQKLEWVLNPRKENCLSCRRLDGKVKRGSFWESSGILPRKPDAPYLICGGWDCGCSLDPTNKPVSRGPLPKLP